MVSRIMGSSVGVHPLWVLFVTLAVKALYGAVFAVPILMVGAAVLRYPSETLLSEDWRKTLLTEIFLKEDKSGTDVAGEELAELRGSYVVGG